MRITIKVIFILLLFLNSLSAQSNNLSLQDVIKRSLEVSPELASLRAGIKASGYRIEQNSNLPDPRLTLGLANLPVNSFSFTQEPMTGKIIGISQGIPFPGKLSAVESLNKFDVNISEVEYVSHKNELIFNVSKEYLELSLVKKNIEITNSMLSLLESVSDVVHNNYVVSKSSQKDVFKVELEKLRLQNKLENLHGEEESHISALMGYMHLDSVVQFLLIDYKEALITNVVPSELLTESIRANPKLQKLKLLRSKAVQKENLAEYEFYPDFNLLLQYSQRDKIASSGTDLHDFFTVLVGMTLPINYGGKKTAQVDEAKSLQTLYDKQFDSMVQQLKISIESSSARLNSLVKREKLISEGMLVQATENYNSSLISYQVVESEFINVIDSIENLLEIETQRYEVITQYYKELIKLNYLTGSDKYSIMQ